MIRIHTVDGRRYDVDVLDWATACRVLTDPDGVFDVTAQTVVGGKLGHKGRTAIPVRNVVTLDQGR